MLETGLRERKKLRARQQLIDAAFKLFTKRGFDETTVADVAGNQGPPRESGGRTCAAGNKPPKR